jgi:hypothetical protein
MKRVGLTGPGFVLDTTENSALLQFDVLLIFRGLDQLHDIALCMPPIWPPFARRG